MEKQQLSSISPSCEETVMVVIDSSTVCSGIAVFVNGKYESHALVDFHKTKDINKRFPMMAKAILSILNQLKPQIVYAEEVYGVNNVQTSRLLFKLLGIIYGWCLENDCEFNAVLPSVWRKALNFKQGKGVKREDLKAQAIEYIKSKYGIDVVDDAADAICIGDYVVDLFKNIEKCP